MTAITKLRSLSIMATMLLSCGRQDDQRHFTAGHDDVGQFILQTAERFGGTPLATNGLTRISEQWSFFEDTNGVAIRLSKETFPVIGEFLHQSFGKPSGYGHSGRYYGYWLLPNHQWGTNNGANLELHQWDTNTEVDILWHSSPTLSMHARQVASSN